MFCQLKQTKDTINSKNPSRDHTKI